MQFFPHDLRQVKYKMLWLDFEKKKFFLLSWVNTTKMTVLSHF